MAQSTGSAFRDALSARLRFYRDLGITEFYRRPVDTADIPIETCAPGPSVGTWDGNQEKQGAPGPFVGTGDRNATIESKIAALRIIRDDIGDCTRCALHKGRNKLVFADGSPMARLMFIGEGPGADEDAQGLPFVGRAGQLLNNMISAMGLKREEVYIANVVKCRPPGNRTPEPDEANTCSPFLFRQIDVVKPEVIVALGATAATYLLGARQPLAGLRGRVHNVRGAKLIVTYHPAYLLRDPRQKKEAWADLQIAMRELGLKALGRN
ncbi:MAG TPA: uracil-DNA glycosylase [Terracidiphilus sp.]|nr:uracil-DNA glycosylase [Terracidiphilus sp.]